LPAPRVEAQTPICASQSPGSFHGAAAEPASAYAGVEEDSYVSTSAA